MGAMPEEIEGILNLLTNRTEEVIGMRTYYSGKINDIETIVVFSRWGKVSAAATVSTLVLNFEITELVFTGVAGAISPTLRIGDIVLGKRLIQHDLDARPLMKQYEIPLLGKTFLETNTAQLDIATNAINRFVEFQNFRQIISSDTLEKFNISAPKLLIGDIASGDVFFSSNQQKMGLYSQLPSIACVEMEGAAVAQVCFEYQLPFTIIRTISDDANDKSHIDFPLFIKDVASIYSMQIIKNLYSHLSQKTNSRNSEFVF